LNPSTGGGPPSTRLDLKPKPKKSPSRSKASTRTPFALNLFWRTFFLLAILLGGGIAAWVQTLRQLEFEPRAVQAAQQIASLVNL
jgi:two-component system, OmpR family, osmolarity sensor histidine kinase EnvZ